MIDILFAFIWFFFFGVVDQIYDIVLARQGMCHWADFQACHLILIQQLCIRISHCIPKVCSYFLLVKNKTKCFLKMHVLWSGPIQDHFWSSGPVLGNQSFNKNGMTLYMFHTITNFISIVFTSNRRKKER